MTGGSGTVSLGARLGGYSGGVPGQGYTAELNGSGLVQLLRAGDWAVLGSYQISGYSAGQWVSLALRADGNALSVDVGGVTRITATDGTYASGDAGVWSFDPASAGQHGFDNFNVQTLGGGGGPTATPTPTNTPTPTPTPSGGFSDDFNRANSTSLGSSWAERSGDLEIHSNALKNVGTAGDNIAGYTGNTYANSETSVRVRIGSGGGSVSVGARWDSGSGAPSQGYNAEMDSSGLVSLLRVSDYAVLGSYQISGYAANTWVTLRLRASGSSLSVDVDGVTRISATDGSFASGQAGVWSYQPSSARAHSFDDFAITQLGASIGSGKALAKPNVAKPAAQTAPPPEVTSYYYFGGKRVAMRKNGVVMWLHSDHLDSASLATDINGNPVVGSETRYKPFGEIRYGSSGLPTDRRFTGYARERANYVGSLDFAQARYYSPYLGRFISADTLVQAPSDPQSLNRYGYTRNNPLRYVDPSGHCFGFALGLDTLGCIGFGMMVASGLGLAGVASYELMPDQIKADAARAIDTLVTDLTRGPASINSTAGSAAGVQQPLVLANPVEPVNGVGTIESFPMGGEAAPLMWSTPLGGSSTVQMGGPLFAKKTKSNVQENKAKGDAFRDDVADAFRQQGYDVDTEVTKQTPFGPRRVDVQVSKDGKVLGGVETKTGNSRYTASQRSKDNWLKRFADYVVNVVRRK